MDLTVNFHLLTIICCAKGFIIKLAYKPVGYLGCFDDSKGKHLHIVLKTSDSNSGDECKERCSTSGYRYAGTKAANQCHCGTKLLNDHQGNRCILECRGRENEICGSSTQISIYDTWECVKAPCGVNTVKCLDISATDYRCLCRAGWTGRNCSEELSPMSTSVLATTTTIARKETTHKVTSVEATTSIRASVTTLSTLFYSNKTIYTSTTSQTIQATHAEKTDKDTTHLWFILAAAGIVVFLFVAIVAFFVGRQRGRQTMNNLAPHSEAAPQDSVYNDLDMTQRFSNQYYELDKIQNRTIDSNKIHSENGANYLTPCTFKYVDTSNEYAYIDIES